MTGSRLAFALGLVFAGGLCTWIYFGAVACRDDARATVQFVDAAGTRSYTVDCDHPRNATVKELCSRRGDSEPREQLRRHAKLQAIAGAKPSPPYARVNAHLGCGSPVTIVIDRSVAAPELLEQAERALKGTGPSPL